MMTLTVLLCEIIITCYGIIFLYSLFTPDFFCFVFVQWLGDTDGLPGVDIVTNKKSF